MWIEYNPNPVTNHVGDCAVRAIAKALNVDWYEAFLELVLVCLQMGDMPSSNAVWGSVLKNEGFVRNSIPNYCPNCYTINDFCQDHPTGLYVLGTGSHVVTVIDGNYYDTWDSGDEIPMYYWEKH